MRWSRWLLGCGVAVPLAYGGMLAVCLWLNPGFDLLHREPSELGRAGVAHGLVYDSGMVATGVLGLLAAIGLMTGRFPKRGWRWVAAAGGAVSLGSVGVAMAGVFPLPDPRHYGFGLTLAAALNPVLGAVGMWLGGDRALAGALGVGFLLIVGLAVGGAPPLAPGVLMLAAIAVLCLGVRQGTLTVRRGRPTLLRS